MHGDVRPARVLHLLQAAERVVRIAFALAGGDEVGARQVDRLLAHLDPVHALPHVVVHGEVGCHALEAHHPAAEALRRILREHVVQFLFQPVPQLLTGRLAVLGVAVHRDHAPQVVVGDGGGGLAIRHDRRAEAESVADGDIRLQLPHDRIRDEVIHGILDHIVAHQGVLRAAHDLAQLLLVGRAYLVHELEHALVRWVLLRIHILQLVVAVLHLVVLNDHIQAREEGPEGARLHHFAVFRLDGFAHALVRVGTEDQIRTFHLGLVRQVYLLGEAHVRDQEDHRTLLVVAQDTDVFRHVHLGLRELDAAAVRR